MTGEHEFVRCANCRRIGDTLRDAWAARGSDECDGCKRLREGPPHRTHQELLEFLKGR